MNMKLLLLICMYLLAIQCGQTTEGKAIEVIGTLINAGNLVAKAIEVYNSIADETRAKALVTVDNFSNYNLNHCKMILTDGVTESTVPYTVEHGFQQAVAAGQNEPGRGINMHFSCSLQVPSSDDVRFIIHFQISQQSAGRKPNLLGVAIVPESSLFRSTNEENVKLAIARSVKWFKDSVKFDSIASWIQCQGSGYMVQATMSTSHQANVEIIVYPTKVADIAGSMKSELNRRQRKSLQCELDNQQVLPQSCNWQDADDGSDATSNSPQIRNTTRRMPKNCDITTTTTANLNPSQIGDGNSSNVQTPNLGVFLLVIMTTRFLMG